MSNEHGEVVTPQNNTEGEAVEVEETESIETETETTETTQEPNKKAKLSDEELLVVLEGRTKRLRKKLGKDSPDKLPQNNKSGELGYAEKAFLNSNGIKGKDELGLVIEIMSDTGKSLDEVIESKHFQGLLKEVREARASMDAIPKGTKRATPITRDSVEYWLAKGELPPVEQVELRRQVVNARIKKETEGSKFAATSVIS